MGVADPDRLGVGGWSYGGILTDYVITKTDRFKAAISGASKANYLAGYGTDHYQYEWEAELGLPWKDRASAGSRSRRAVLRGREGHDADAVPVRRGRLERAAAQLRAALPGAAAARRADTELVVYPGESHEIETPSYQKDRLERYLAWYDKFLKPAPAAAGPAPEATSLLGRPWFAPALPARAEEGARGRAWRRRTADFARDPDDADNIVWLGRRDGG